jgi:hypothetical protein
MHALRAFFVTTLLEGHVPVHVVRELVGHGDLATTQMYAAIVDGDQGAAVEVLDRVYESAREKRGDDQASVSTERGTRCRQRPTRRRRGALWRRILRRQGTGNNSETAPIAAQ